MRCRGSAGTARTDAVTSPLIAVGMIVTRDGFPASRVHGLLRAYAASIPSGDKSNRPFLIAGHQ